MKLLPTSHEIMFFPSDDLEICHVGETTGSHAGRATSGSLADSQPREGATMEVKASAAFG